MSDEPAARVSSGRVTALGSGRSPASPPTGVRGKAGELGGWGDESRGARIDTAPHLRYLVEFPIIQITNKEDAVFESFVQRHAGKVIGVLSGFDRLVFRGTLRRIVYATGLKHLLDRHHVLLKDFPEVAKARTERLKAASLALAEETGRPVVYLPSSKTSKEETAREIAERDGIRDGLVAVLKSVEPCRSFEVHGNRATKKLELRGEDAKCLHLYHYFIDPHFGFLGARIQTWLPFSIQITVNGREWLARAMDKAGIRYLRFDNCFPWIEDLPRAQRLMDHQLRVYLPRHLDRLARLLNPAHGRMFRGDGLEYYWTIHQSEWASDVMFTRPAALSAVYPGLVRHAMTTIGSGEVMNFLGQKVSGRFAGEIVSDFKQRPEGVRVKHRVGANSVKIYDKAAVILRAETTINDPKALKVLRTREGHPDEKPEWRPMRKSVADIGRRAEVSAAANERYLDALAPADTTQPVGDILDGISRRRKWKGRGVRALRPSAAPDRELFRLLASGEFALLGLRNRDVQAALYPRPASGPKEKRRRAARATRLLRILRAHGLIQKIPHSHRYHVTPRGTAVSKAAVMSHAITLAKLETAA